MQKKPPAGVRDMALAFVDLYPQEVARSLEDAPVEQIVPFLQEQTAGRAASLLERLDPPVAAGCIEQLTDEASRLILPALDLGRLAALLARLDPQRREQKLALIDSSIANEVRQIVEYPEGTAGRIMDPRFSRFRPDQTVKQVLSRLRTLRQQRIRDLYLVNDAEQLVGVVPLPEVVMAEPAQRLGELSQASVPSVLGTAAQEEVVDVLAQSKLASLPVVDVDGRLIGVIRQIALVRAVTEEATVGIQTMVGVSKEERALSSSLFAVRKRLPWLNVNLLTAFLAASVVGIFEGTIAKVTALAVLLPVVAGQSGNTGAQALAVTMRGLALREVRLGHWLRIIVKEAIAGAVNGLAIAVVTMVGVYIWSQSPPLCAVIGVSMVISMAMAGVAGAAIPMLLTALRQDPAQSSSIILTTVTDVVGFLSFLGLATLLVRYLAEGG